MGPAEFAMALSRRRLRRKRSEAVRLAEGSAEKTQRRQTSGARGWKNTLGEKEGGSCRTKRALILLSGGSRDILPGRREVFIFRDKGESYQTVEPLSVQQLHFSNGASKHWKRWAAPGLVSAGWAFFRDGIMKQTRETRPLW